MKPLSAVAAVTKTNAPFLLTTCVIIFTRRRSCSFAEYWKYLARLNGVYAFGYNSAGSERIWMKFGGLRIYCLELALTDTKSQNMSRTSHSDLVTHQSIHITQRVSYAVVVKW